MTRRTLIAFVLAAGALRGVDKVPDFDVTDSYATSPTMLARAGIDGTIREVWTGMDPAGMRHVPLFLETTIFGSIRTRSGWLDLRTLKYSRAGTRPGRVHLRSEDGRVTIEVSARKNGATGPMFVRYTFAAPVDFRLAAGFKYPQFTRGFRADDASGAWEYATLWRHENPVLTTVEGPALVLATLPEGRTLAPEGGSEVKEFGSVSSVLLCIDATGTPVGGSAAKAYAARWAERLGGTGDTESEYVPNRVTLATDNPKLDRLFECSVDAVVSEQFASGDVMGDSFFYRDSWLRDGSYSVIGLSLAGDHEAADRYFAFWDAQRDFSVGGEREAQQPSIALMAMWVHSRLRDDGAAFLRQAWPYAKYYGDYYAGRIAREGMLSVSEEWICFIPAPASWPNAEIYGGLRAAVKMARELGHEAEARSWSEAADTLRTRFLAQAYDAGKGRIIPMAGAPGQVFTDPDYPKAESRNGPLRDDRVDAGMLIIGRFEAFGRGEAILPVDDPRFTSTQAQIVRDLENPDHSLFRFGPNPASPHAPQGELDTWPIISAWAAQDEWLLGRTDLAWRYLVSGVLNKDNDDLQAGCYYLPENRDRKGFADKPLITWSHGDFVTSVLLLMLGLDLEPNGADVGLAPSLPPGVNHAFIGNFSFGNWRMDVELTRAAGGIEVDVAAAMKHDLMARPALSVRMPSGRNIRIPAGERRRFKVDPSHYYLQFGRSAHAAERASTSARILGVPEAVVSGAKTAAQLEELMCRIESAHTSTAVK
jgi:hypothetical protein